MGHNVVSKANGDDGMVKVSIIVPVYNVEQYLRRCVDSLLSQTLEEIEIILINDASPDNSHLIMQEYEKTYAPKVRCIYLKENLRLGGARNKGIEAAIGEYVTFVDSDDSIEPEMCERMYRKAYENNSDVVFCDFSLVWETTGRIRNRTMVTDAQMGEVTKEKLKSLLFADHYAWAKLIRRSLIIEHGIFFPEHRMYEDIPTTRFYLFYSKRIDKVNGCFYKYYQRESSITHYVDATFQFDEAEMALLFYEECKKRGFVEEFDEEIKMLFTLMFYLYPINNCFEKFSAPPVEYMSYLQTKMREIYPNYQSNHYIHKIAEPRLILQAKDNDISPEYLMERYHDKDYYDNADNYITYYSECDAKLSRLFDYCKTNKYNIAIWGLGIKGTAFLKYCEGHQYKVHSVIDKSDRLIGKRLETGNIVKDFSEVKNEVDIIFIMNKNFLYDIQKEVFDTNTNIIVLNLDGYLCFDIRLDDWIKSGTKEKSNGTE